MSIARFKPFHTKLNFVALHGSQMLVLKFSIKYSYLDDISLCVSCHLNVTFLRHEISRMDRIKVTMISKLMFSFYCLFMDTSASLQQKYSLIYIS